MKSTVNAVKVQRSENSQNIGDFRVDIMEEIEFHSSYSLWKITEVEHAKLIALVNQSRWLINIGDQ